MRLTRIPATIFIITMIIAMFILEMVTGSSRDAATVVRLGGIIDGTFQPSQLWRLVAAMFLHHGPLHLGMNLWALYQLGALFEVMFGSKRMLFTYFASGLVASIASAATIDPYGVSAGASGAIFGLMGALIFAIKRSPVWRHQRWTKSLVQQLVVWAVINVVIGLQIEAIDNAAHLGGFAAGLLLGFIRHDVPPPPSREMTIEAEARAIEPGSGFPKNEP